MILLCRWELLLLIADSLIKKNKLAFSYNTSNTGRLLFLFLMLRNTPLHRCPKTGDKLRNEIEKYKQPLESNIRVPDVTHWWLFYGLNNKTIFSSQLGFRVSNICKTCYYICLLIFFLFFSLFILLRGSLSPRDALNILWKYCLQLPLEKSKFKTLHS